MKNSHKIVYNILLCRLKLKHSSPQNAERGSAKKIWAFSLSREHWHKRIANPRYRRYNSTIKTKTSLRVKSKFIPNSFSMIFCWYCLKYYSIIPVKKKNSIGWAYDKYIVNRVEGQWGNYWLRLINDVVFVWKVL